MEDQKLAIPELSKTQAKKLRQLRLRHIEGQRKQKHIMKDSVKKYAKALNKNKEYENKIEELDKLLGNKTDESK